MRFLEYSLSFLLIALLASCSNEVDGLLETTSVKFHHPDDYVVSINTSRHPFNLLDEDSALFNCGNVVGGTRSADDYFTVEKDVSSNETVVLHEYSPHVWLGNVLYRSSVADCTYRPISGSKNPIMVSLSLLGTESSVISYPSYSRYTSYIKQQIQKSSFKQNDEFLFSIEQFTSYNEIKSAFGSNVNTNFLFWGSSSSSSGMEHHINKATGIYLKFWQSSFTAVMDTPNIPYANVSAALMDSAVYINSITYGRFGLLTLETNAEASYAKRMIQESFHTLFTKGSSYITSQERNFLDGCDFKVYLIGGNGTTAVQSFYGFTGFVDHIAKGQFSKEQPGVPIFCSFANVADNSLARIKFKYNIRREPLYVDIIDNNAMGAYCDSHVYTMKFYANQSKVPTIAHPKVKFRFKFDVKYENAPSIYRDTTYVQEYSNAGYGTSMPLFSYNSYLARTVTHPIGRDDTDTNIVWEIYTDVKLLDSPDYKLLNIISLRK
jgi:putative hemolysin